MKTIFKTLVYLSVAVIGAGLVFLWLIYCDAIMSFLLSLNFVLIVSILLLLYALYRHLKAWEKEKSSKTTDRIARTMKNEGKIHFSKN